MIPNRPESVCKRVMKLGAVGELQMCNAVGPNGDVLQWQLTALGVMCEVVALALVPVKAKDRVKKNRQDALKLAWNYQAEDLTTMWGSECHCSPWVRGRQGQLEQDLKRVWERDSFARLETKGTPEVPDKNRRTDSRTLNWIYWRRAWESEPSGALETRKLVIPHNDRTDKNGRKAQPRYVAGT